MNVSKFFLPVGLSWLTSVINPSNFTRALYKDLSAVSLICPWILEWYAIAEYVLAQESGAGSLTDGAFLGFLAFYVLHTLTLQMIP